MPRYDLNIAIFDTIRYIVPSLQTAKLAFSPFSKTICLKYETHILVIIILKAERHQHCLSYAWQMFALYQVNVHLQKMPLSVKNNFASFSTLYKNLGAAGPQYLYLVIYFCGRLLLQQKHSMQIRPFWNLYSCVSAKSEKSHSRFLQLWSQFARYLRQLYLWKFQTC